MVTSMDVTLIISAATFIISVGTSMFVSGTRWGRVEQTLKDLETDRVRSSDVMALRERLSKIEGMFTLTLKDPGNNG